MNKNIIHLIGDINRTNIENELMNNIYIIKVTDLSLGYQNDSSILYQVEKSETIFYQKLYLSNKYLFSNLCSSLFDKYTNINTILLDNNIKYTDAYNIYSKLIHIHNNEYERYKKIYDSIKLIISDISTNDLKNIDNYCYYYKIEISKLNSCDKFDDTNYFK